MNITSEQTSGPVQGNWIEQKAKLKRRFPALTDADLIYEHGKKDEMFYKLKRKLGKTEQELSILIETL